MCLTLIIQMQISQWYWTLTGFLFISCYKEQMAFSVNQLQLPVGLEGRYRYVYRPTLESSTEYLEKYIYNEANFNLWY